MAASLVHIAFGLKYLEKRPELDELELLRGTVFPDVRRAAGLPRDATHRYDVTLDEIDAETDSWQAGWLLHSYLDMAWNNFFVDRGLVVNRAMDEATWRALKTAEEADMFEHIAGRERLAELFEQPLGEHELASPARPEAVIRWYAFVAWKLREPYEPISWKRQQATVGIAGESADELIPLTEQFRHDPVWQGHLQELHKVLGLT